MRRALQKQNRGEKPRKQSTQFQGVKIFAHLISRCENFAHPKTKVRNPWAKTSQFRTPLPQGAKSISRCEFPKIQFRTPLWKVRKFSHCAKSSPGTRVPISHTPSSFSHCAKRCAKISHTTVQDAKISHTSFQGANFIVQRGQFSHT